MKKTNIKRTLMTAALVATMSVCNAQIFIMDNDEEQLSPRATTEQVDVMIVPAQGLSIDQYAVAPIGSGALLLAGMAGAYAFAKRRKRE